MNYMKLIAIFVLLTARCLLAADAALYLLAGYGSSVPDASGAKVLTNIRGIADDPAGPSTLDLLRDVKIGGIPGGGTKDVVLIGHSQGGLRAMGYASSVFASRRAYIGSEMKTTTHNVKAVITIGSPVGGGSPLARKNTTKERMNDWLARIGDGIEDGIPFYGVATSVLGGVRHPETDVKIALLSNLRGSDGFGALGQDVINGIPPDTSKGAWDMAPLSEFMMKYIVPAHFNPVVKREWTGNVIEWRKGYYKKWGIKIKYYYPVLVDTYRYYTVQEYASNNSPAFSGVKLAHIVGEKQSLDQMVRDSGAYGDYKKAIDVYLAATDALAKLDIAAAGYFGGIAASNWYDPVVSIPATIAAAACAWSCDRANAGHNAVSGREKEWNRVLGTTEGDTFIPKSDQYLTQAQSGGTMLSVGGRLLGSYVSAPESTHVSEQKDALIWGNSGARLGTTEINQLKDTSGFIGLAIDELERTGTLISSNAMKTWN